VCNQARQNKEVCNEARQKKMVCNHGTLMHGQQVAMNNMKKGTLTPWWIIHIHLIYLKFEEQ
jgi:hypothetical protein